MFGKKKPSQSKKQTDPIAGYVDPISGVSNRELDIAEWWVRHKQHVEKVGTGALAAIAIGLLSYGIIGWVVYFANGFWEDRQMLVDQRQQEVQMIGQQFGPQDLAFGSPAVYDAGGGVYDFVSRVSNPNTRHIARVTYHFAYVGGQTEVVDTLVLPGQDVPLVVFGGASELARRPSLVIDNVEWRRIDPHAVFDVSAYMEERLNFAVSDVQFLRGNALRGTAAHEVQFMLKNESAYGFWDAHFVVELYNGSRPVGVMQFAESEFGAGEEREVGLRTNIDGFEVTNITVHPRVNVFDSSEFLPVGFAG